MNAQSNHAAHGAAMNYGDYGFWLESLGDITPRAALKGDVSVDVAILGGGFAGLWTAYYLLRDNPGMEVAIVEAEVCGFGASGRNGGWCSPRFPLDATALLRRFGKERARAQILAMHDTVHELQRVCEAESLDVEYRRADLLSIARGEAQLPLMRASYDAYQALGLDEHNQLIDADAVRERVRVAHALGAILTPDAAMIHPAKLVRGLADSVEKLGGVIYEKTSVRRVERGARPALVAENGSVRAKRAVVVAGEAYLSGLPGFRTDVIPMSSMIILTEPLSQAAWAEIGWEGGEGLASQIASVDYLTKTRDGRILYGSRGERYAFGSKIPDENSRRERAYALMHSALVDWFPVIRDAAITHRWGGYLGVNRDWAPSIYYHSDLKIGGLHGFTGRGVPNTNLGARIMAGLIAGKNTGLESLPAAQHRSPQWEPEPLRWFGVRYVQNAFSRIDAHAAAGRKAPLDAWLARRLSRQ